MMPVALAWKWFWFNWPCVVCRVWYSNGFQIEGWKYSTNILPENPIGNWHATFESEDDFARRNE